MRRIISLVLIAFLGVCTIMAQDAPKKKGGFWNKVKKGVESATGIDVSKETLFVYPNLGEWKMELKSAEGDSLTGNVNVIFKVMPLAGQKQGLLKIQEITDGEGRKLVPDKNWEVGSNSYQFSTGSFTECPLRRITVTPGMKSLKSIKFKISNQEGFEARDIAIKWIKVE